MEQEEIRQIISMNNVKRLNVDDLQYGVDIHELKVYRYIDEHRLFEASREEIGWLKERLEKAEDALFGVLGADVLSLIKKIFNNYLEGKNVNLRSCGQTVSIS